MPKTQIINYLLCYLLYMNNFGSGINDTETAKEIREVKRKICKMVQYSVNNNNHNINI